MQKRIVLCQSTIGEDAEPTGDYFIAIISPDGDGKNGYLQSNLTPASWEEEFTLRTYGDSRKDEVVVSKILDQIAKMHSIKGINSARRIALKMLKEAGDEGIKVDLTREEWYKIEHPFKDCSFEERLRLEKVCIVPHLER